VGSASYGGRPSLVEMIGAIYPRRAGLSTRLPAGKAGARAAMSQPWGTSIWTYGLFNRHSGCHIPYHPALLPG
jgi:hypothetical protein